MDHLAAEREGQVAESIAPGSSERPAQDRPWHRRTTLPPAAACRRTSASSASSYEHGATTYASLRRART